MSKTKTTQPSSSATTSPPQKSPEDVARIKQCIENLLNYITDSKPDPEKIAATPIIQQKVIVANALNLLEDPSLKTLTTKDKTKQIILVTRGFIDAANADDVDFKKYKDKFNEIIESMRPTRKRGLPQTVDETSTKKQFNKEKKIKKTVASTEEISIPKKWLRWTPQLLEPTVIVPTTATLSSEDLVKLIEINKMEGKIKAEITNLRPRDEMLIVRLSETRQVNVFIKDLKKLDKSLTPEIPEPRDPMIKIHDVPMGLEVDQFIENVKKFNNFNKNDKIIFQKTTKSLTPEKENLILRVSPAIRDEIEKKRGSILYLCSKLQVTDFFSIIQCKRCFKYSHSKFTCGSQTMCKFCSKYHQAFQCDVRHKPEFFKCPACLQPGHFAGDYTCPEHIKQLKFATAITNYEYNYIMLN